MASDLERAPVRIASRGSRLALAQTEAVRTALSTHHPERSFEIQVISTRGDRLRERPLPEIGGKGLFTEDLEHALRKGKVSMAVHSVKDLPVSLPEGLRLGCITSREDPRDCLVARDGSTFDNLPPGSRVGTSSPRRRAQVLLHRRDLEVVDLRGAVETRIRKVREGACDAAILARAGLSRLGLEDEIAEVLGFDLFIPPAGQGALGVEIRADDRDGLALLSSIEDPGARAEVDAEIACLAALGGGCRTPIGAVARVDGEEIDLRAGVFSPDGKSAYRVRLRGPRDDPQGLGRKAAMDLLEQGAEAFVRQANQ